MSGLSVAAFISIRRDATALSSVARTAPKTCGMHRSVYGSCTLCGPLWDGIISLARRRRRRFAATSLAPGCGFSPTRRSSNGFGDPRSASKDIEAATWASFSNRRPSFTKMAPTAAITDVPLMIARPSLDWRTSGARFAFARALSPGRTCPPTSASPSPMSTRPKCARGARSPLAPNEPRDGITGWTPRFKKSRRRDTRIRRTPEYPIASVFARSRRAARTSSRRSGGPRPIAWLRNRLSCSARTSASEIGTFASSPKPVLIPYAREPFATTISRARRLASMRFAAAGASRTGSPLRATAITTSRSSDRPSIERMRTVAASRFRDIAFVRGPKALSPYGRSGAVHASRVPRHLRIVADAEAERERGRDQARSRGGPVRLRRRHAAAVHAEQAELHAGLPRLRVPLPRRPFPRAARDGPEHVDERTRGAPRGVRSARYRAARRRAAVPRLLHARIRRARERTAAGLRGRLRRIRRACVRGRPHGPVRELCPRRKDAAGPVQRGAGGSPRGPERAAVQPAPGGRTGDDPRSDDSARGRAGSAAAWTQDRVHGRHDAPRGHRRDGAPCGPLDPRRDVGCGPGGEGESLWPLILPAGRGDREGGRGGLAGPHAPQSAI